MGYSVYYNGEIGISPELSKEHEALLDEALTKDNFAGLGIATQGMSSSLLVTAAPQRSLEYIKGSDTCEGERDMIEEERRRSHFDTCMPPREKSFHPVHRTHCGG